MLNRKKYELPFYLTGRRTEFRGWRDRHEMWPLMLWPFIWAGMFAGVPIVFDWIILPLQNDEALDKHIVIAQKWRDHFDERIDTLEEYHLTPGEQSGMSPPLEGLSPPPSFNQTHTQLGGTGNT